MPVLLALGSCCTTLLGGPGHVGHPARGPRTAPQPAHPCNDRARRGRDVARHRACRLRRTATRRDKSQPIEDRAEEQRDRPVRASAVHRRPAARARGWLLRRRQPRHRGGGRPGSGGERQPGPGGGTVGSRGVASVAPGRSGRAGRRPRSGGRPPRPTIVRDRRAGPGRDRGSARSGPGAPAQRDHCPLSAVRDRYPSRRSSRSCRR